MSIETGEMRSPDGGPDPVAPVPFRDYYAGGQGRVARLTPTHLVVFYGHRSPEEIPHERVESASLLTGSKTHLVAANLDAGETVYMRFSDRETARDLADKLTEGYDGGNA